MGKIWLLGLLEPLQKAKQETGTKSATREGPSDSRDALLSERSHSVQRCRVSARSDWQWHHSLGFTSILLPLLSLPDEYQNSPNSPAGEWGEQVRRLPPPWGERPQ